MLFVVLSTAGPVVVTTSRRDVSVEARGRLGGGRDSGALDGEVHPSWRRSSCEVVLEPGRTISRATEGFVSHSTRPAELADLD